jgi:hypothetical protein
MQRLYTFTSLFTTNDAYLSIFLNRVRQKQLVYDVLSLCGLLIPCGHLHPAYACEIHELIFCDVYGVDRFFFYLALFNIFPFTNIVNVRFYQPGTIPAACERTAKVGVSG